VPPQWVHFVDFRRGFFLLLGIRTRLPGRTGRPRWRSRTPGTPGARSKAVPQSGFSVLASSSRLVEARPRRVAPLTRASGSRTVQSFSSVSMIRSPEWQGPPLSMRTNLIYRSPSAKECHAAPRPRRVLWFRSQPGVRAGCGLNSWPRRS